MQHAAFPASPLRRHAGYSVAPRAAVHAISIACRRHIYLDDRRRWKQRASDCHRCLSLAVLLYRTRARAHRCHACQFARSDAQLKTYAPRRRWELDCSCRRRHGCLKRLHYTLQLLRRHARIHAATRWRVIATARRQAAHQAWRRRACAGGAAHGAGINAAAKTWRKHCRGRYLSPPPSFTATTHHNAPRSGAGYSAWIIVTANAIS